MNKKVLVLALVMSTAVIAETTEVLLSWTPPSTRANGDPLALTDIQSYGIAVVCNEGYERLITIEGGATDNTVVSGLPVDTCHFSVFATDTDGLTSEASDIVSKAITDVIVTDPKLERFEASVVKAKANVERKIAAVDKAVITIANREASLAKARAALVVKQGRLDKARITLEAREVRLKNYLER